MIYWIFLNRTNHRGRRGESAKQTTCPSFWPLCSRTDHCFLSGSQYSKGLPLVFGHWLPGLQQTTHNLANFAGESPSFYTFRFSIRSDLQTSCSSFVTTFVYCFSCLSLPEFSRKVSFPFLQSEDLLLEKPALISTRVVPSLVNRERVTFCWKETSSLRFLTCYLDLKSFAKCCYLFFHLLWPCALLLSTCRHEPPLPQEKIPNNPTFPLLLCILLSSHLSSCTYPYSWPVNCQDEIKWV